VAPIGRHLVQRTTLYQAVADPDAATSLAPAG
jgi:hypothetical protein